MPNTISANHFVIGNFDIRGGIDYGCSDNKTVIDLIYDMYSYYNTLIYPSFTYFLHVGREALTCNNQFTTFKTYTS